METSVFKEKSNQPTNDLLLKTLEEKWKLWEAIKQHIKEKHGDTTEEWRFYSVKYGWTLKTLLKKRNLFFFAPLNGYFRVTFVFGDKAVTAVEKSDLSENIKSELKNARKYVEGRGIRIEVKNQDDVENVKKLIDIKVSN